MIACNLTTRLFHNPVGFILKSGVFACGVTVLQGFIRN